MALNLENMQLEAAYTAQHLQKMRSVQSVKLKTLTICEICDVCTIYLHTFSFALHAGRLSLLWRFYLYFKQSKLNLDQLGLLYKG